MKLAKKNKNENKIGALYDIARNAIRNRRMKKRTEKSLKKQKKKKVLFKGLNKQKDFKDIAKKWNVIIGITKQDLWRLKE